MKPRASAPAGATRPTDETWQKIANEAIASAERVPCDLLDFAAGLRTIELEIRFRRELAEEEAEAES